MLIKKEATTPFVGYEIAACVPVDILNVSDPAAEQQDVEALYLQGIERMDAIPEAYAPHVFHTLYGRTEDGLALAIGDYASAIIAAEVLTMILGQDVEIDTDLTRNVFESLEHWTVRLGKLVIKTLTTASPKLQFDEEDAYRLNAVSVYPADETVSNVRLSWNMQFDFNGMGGNIADVSQELWREYKRKLNDIIATIQVKIEDDDDAPDKVYTFLDALARLNEQRPGLQLEPCLFDYTEDTITYYYNDNSGNYIELTPVE